MIIEMTFDPVTESEIEFLKRFRKEKGLKDLQVTVCGEGVLEKQLRMDLLRRALKPYRHICVTEETGDLAIRDFMPDEEQVRSGLYYLAAKGIRSILSESSLFLDEIAGKMCTEKRAVHSKGTAETAARLALKHGVSPGLAYRAGMLHDITKRWSEEQGREYLRRREPEVLKLNPKIWHSYTAAWWMKENMGITDPVLLNAVRHHTVGDGLTKLDHILYIADKTEPGRKYNCEAELRLAGTDLKKAAALVKQEAIQYILDKEGIDVGNTGNDKKSS